MEGGVEIEGAMGEDKSASVDEAESKMEGSRGEWRGREIESEGLARSVLDAPLKELSVEVGTARDEHEAMGRKDGSRAFVVGGGECACECDADIGVETGSPHEDEVFAELVCPCILAVTLFGGLCGIEEEFKGLTETLAGIEIFELV